MKLRHNALMRLFQVRGGNLYLSGDNKSKFEGDEINDSRSRNRNWRQSE